MDYLWGFLLQPKQHALRSKRHALRHAIGGHQPGFPNRGSLDAGRAQAGRLEIGPGLLRAVAANRANVEPVGLGEGLRHAGLDRGRKSRKNGKGSGGKGSNRDSGKSFDHDGPWSWAVSARGFVNGLIPTGRFGMSSLEPKMVSSRPSFVSSTRRERNIQPAQTDALTPEVVHLPA